MAYRIGGLDIQRALPGKLALLALLFIFFPCNPKSQWNFSTSYFGISVDNRGFVTSMKNVMATSSRVFSPENKASPFQYVIHSPDAEQIPLPNHLKFEGGSEATVFIPESKKVQTISVDRSQFEIVKGNHNLIFECQFAKGIENVVKIEMKTMNDGDEISLK